MTCEKCGREIPEGQRFCGFCGTAAETKTTALSTQERNDISSRLRMAEGVCKRANVHFKNGKQKLAYAKNIYYSASTNFWVWFALLFCSPVFLVAILLMTFSLWSFIFLTIPLIIALVVGYILFPVFFVKRKKAKGKKVEEESQKERELGAKVLSDNAELLSILPFDYRYPLAIDYIAKLFETDRVDSMREALRMFDEQKHRWTVERAQHQILNAQKEQAALLDDIRSDVNFMTWFS
jgi:hypothetical protein